MLIAMDQPKHDQQRKAVSPVVAPSNLLLLEPIIRERAGSILDALPVGEEIDWVKLVSVELATMTLATIFNFPWEARSEEHTSELKSLMRSSYDVFCLKK